MSGTTSRLFAFFQLMRIANLPTAIADIAMGVLVVGGTNRGTALLWLGLASAALYSAGMVLNDVYDFEVDSKQRPDRPLPAGRIARRVALRLGYFLLGFGISVAAMAGLYQSAPGVPVWRSGLIAVLLAVAIVLYDAVFKPTVLGPLLMGSCRMLNVLLGMSLAAAGGAEPLWLGYGGFHWAIAAGIGIYIVGVTWFARTEATTSARGQLAFGLAVMVAGVGLLAWAPRWSPAGQPFYLDPRVVWPGLLCLIMFVLIRRCVAAIASPRPAEVQSAVKLSILSLIVLDSAVVSFVSPWYCALAVLALLAPTLWLGRWIYST